MEYTSMKKVVSRLYCKLSLLTSLLIILASEVEACKTSTWRNMSMVERLSKSTIVLYGRDIDHGKFRIPTELDARFDVYCIIKAGLNRIPGQVIIKQINEGEECSGVKNQMVEGREYIVGLERQLDGFMTYADINPLEETAFPATDENFEILAATCDLDQWSSPETGEQEKCPSASKPLFCTKFRDPDAVSRSNSVTFVVLAVMTVVFHFFKLFLV